AGFLSFRMSGGRSLSQRIELQVKNGRANEYFGIRFPGVLGDPSAGGSLGHGTQFPTVPPASALFPPPTSGFTVERSVTSEDLKETDWMQTYVFDLRRFRGREVQIRIVDDARLECAVFDSGRCTQMAP